MNVILKMRGLAAVSGEAIRAILGAAQFVLLAKLLGPQEFGGYAQVVAGSALLTPFAMVGAGFWIQPEARRMADRNGLAGSIHSLVLMVCVPSAIVLAATLPLFGLASGFWDFLWVSLSEVAFFAGWAHLCLLELGLGNQRRYVLTLTVMSGLKVAVVAFALAMNLRSLRQYGLVSLSSGILGYLIYSLVFFRGVRPTMRIWRSHVRSGFGYATVATVSAITDQLDKIVLGLLVTPIGLGSYSVASKTESFALVPVRGFALDTYPRYFEDVDRHDFSSLWVDARRSVLSGWATSIPMSMALIIGVQRFHETIFPGYPDLPVTVAIFCLVAPLRAVHYAAGDILYALGQMATRLMSLLVVAVGFVGALVFVAPRYGIQGAAWCAVAAEAGLSCLLIMTAIGAVKKMRETTDSRI